MKRYKEEEHLIKGPLTNSINLKEDGPEEKKEQTHPNDFSSNHHEEVWLISHLPHQTDLYEEQKPS